MGLGSMYDLMYSDPDKTYEIYDPENPNMKSTLKIIQTLTNLPTKEAHDFYTQLYTLGVESFGAGASDMDKIKLAAIALGWPEWQLESEKEKQEKKETEKKKKKEEQKWKKSEFKAAEWKEAEW